MPIPGRLYSGGINVTYRCNAACKHCITASSPRRENRYVDPETIRIALRKIKSLGCFSLHIGGGEPFLDFNALCGLLKTMREENVAIDYIETNAFWALGKPADAEKLRSLTALGADTIMFSLCPYHAEHVPLQRVANAIKAANEAGMSYFVFQGRFAEKIAALGDMDKVHSLSEYESAYPGAVARLPGEFGVRLIGRAAIYHSDINSQSVERLLQSDKPCDVLQKIGNFHIDLYGCLTPGGCGGFAIPVENLDNLDIGSFPAAKALLHYGVSGIYEIAKGFGFEPNDKYPGLCALCQHIRAYLAISKPDAWPDLRPLDFYEELYEYAR